MFFKAQIWPQGAEEHQSKINVSDRFLAFLESIAKSDIIIFFLERMISFIQYTYILVKSADLLWKWTPKPNASFVFSLHYSSVITIISVSSSLCLFLWLKSMIHESVYTLYSLWIIITEKYIYLFLSLHFPHLLHTVLQWTVFFFAD